MGAKHTSKKVRPPPTPKAPQPWDIPQFPKNGNHGPAKIHRSVGRALDNWGWVENYLGYIFSRFVGALIGREVAVRAYGSVITFRGRCDMLSAAAEVYFTRYPNTDLQTEFSNFLRCATQFGARRNEIAHGIVDYYGHFVPRKQKKYVLGPSVFATNKRHILPASGTGTSHVLMPKYIYTAEMIDNFSQQFLLLTRQAYAVYEKLDKAVTEREKASREKYRGRLGVR